MSEATPGLRHVRHYTLDEANGALPWISECLERLREAQAVVSDEGGREALARAAAESGGGFPNREVAEALGAWQATIAELDAADVVLRDVERGLFDFPALRDGEEIYLCWVDGEERIAFWHDPEAGFAGRQPL
ncbi:MAG: hypothetical protein QOI98_484 [Solirubrobacteraceae bacterium]|jgi:hypothetical protein|nr:hypothetical protein [Solirubrobacteraceae bacterium]